MSKSITVCLVSLKMTIKPWRLFIYKQYIIPAACFSYISGFFGLLRIKLWCWLQQQSFIKGTPVWVCVWCGSQTTGFLHRYVISVSTVKSICCLWKLSRKGSVKGCGLKKWSQDHGKNLRTTTEHAAVSVCTTIPQMPFSFVRGAPDI